MNKKMIFLSALLLIGLLSSCSLNDDINLPNSDYKVSQVISIFVTNDSVCASVAAIDPIGLRNEYYIKDKAVSLKQITDALPVGRHIETLINSEYANLTLFKKGAGKLVHYRFYKRNDVNHPYQLSYIKEGKYVQLDTVNAHPEIYGTISAVDVRNGVEVFAGTFKKQVLSATENGFSLTPSVPFFLTGKNITKLPFPSDIKDVEYSGINSVYLDEMNNVYVTGKMSRPMYWINDMPIVLGENKGEVLEVTTVGKTVYAVGYINKYGSRSVNNTACYWRNGKLVELEEQAVATSIFIDGDDIYIGGATGRTPDDYQACYWKNGVKFVLNQSRS